MTNKLNILLATDWLFPILKKQLMSIHNKLKLPLDTDELTLIANHYHSLHSVLKIAELSRFSELARLIELTLKSNINNTLSLGSLYQALYSSKLLLIELTLFVKTGSYHKELIAMRQHSLSELLESDEELSDGEKDLFLPINNFEQIVCFTNFYKGIELSESIVSKKLLTHQYDLLLKSWRYALNTLLKEGSAYNDKLLEATEYKNIDIQGCVAEYKTIYDCIGSLKEVCQYLVSDAKARRLSEYAELWYVTQQWLESLSKNEVPVSAYIHLLSNLDQLIGLQMKPRKHLNILDSFLLSQVLTDIYAHISCLVSVNQQATQIINHVEDSAFKATLFTNVISQLDLISEHQETTTTQYKLQILKGIRSQLNSRGWHKLSGSVNRIINQAFNEKDEHSFTSSNASIDKPVAGLRHNIENTYNAIRMRADEALSHYVILNDDESIKNLSTASHTNQKKSATVESNQSLIYSAFQALQSLKLAFNNYCIVNDAQLLINDEQFLPLCTLFNEMDDDTLYTIAKRLERIFENIQTYELNKITWDLFESVTDVIVLFELFIEHLSNQTYSTVFIEKIECCLSDAESQIIKVIDQPNMENSAWANSNNQKNFFDINTIYYDDEGKVEVNDQSIDVVKDIVMNEVDLSRLTDLTPEVIQNVNTQDNSILENNSLTQTSHNDKPPQDYYLDDYPNESSLPDVLLPFLASVSIEADSDEADKDIKSIFVEEAYEVLEEIILLFNKCRRTQDIKHLEDVRRGFHTIKGSGKMVGAHCLAEVALAIERMLTRISDNAVEPTADMQLLVGEILDHFSEMIKTFENGTNDYPKKVRLWIACANAYSRNLHTEFDYQSVSSVFDSIRNQKYREVSESIDNPTENTNTDFHFDTTDAIVKSSDGRGDLETAIEVDDFSFSHDTDSENGIALFNATPASSDLIKPSDSLDDHSELTQVNSADVEKVNIDPDLLAIFLEEAQEIDEAVSFAFREWSQDITNTESIKTLQRHLHTLKGGARMTGILSIADLAHEAETIYEGFLNRNIEPTRAWIDVMQGVQDILTSQVQQVLVSGESYYATQTVEQLQSLAKSKKIESGFELYTPQYAIVTSEVDIAVSEANLLSQKESLISTQNDNAIVNKLERKTQSKSLNRLLRLTVDGDINTESSVQLDFNRLKSESWQGSEPDSDILSVFLEEAQCSVKNLIKHFTEISEKTINEKTFNSIKDELHILKSDASMVDTNGLAELTHCIEKFVEHLFKNNLPNSQPIKKLIKTCENWLNQAVFLLSYGINPPVPMHLIDALNQFTHTFKVPTDEIDFLLQDYVQAINNYEAWKSSCLAQPDISEMPSWLGEFSKPDSKPKHNTEMIRVPSNMMERMLNLAGESSINRARIDMNIVSLNNTLDEMAITVQRLVDQLRRMDIELETQILPQIEDKDLLDNEGFDPLEMDQYSALNQLSKSLSESASDLLDLKRTIRDKTRNAEDLLLQLSRTHTDLQDALMSSRMVPFSRLTSRLQRVVRQTAKELGKEVELKILSDDDEIDRTILERITSPLEHMLRNAVDHGIELPKEREMLGKSSTGNIVLEVTRDGSEVVIKLSDDGSGIDIEAVKIKAIEQGLIDASDSTLTELDIMQYVFNAGLTTTNKVTQISGRGVGMDVVMSEIRQLGGTVAVNSQYNKGSVFSIRVPLTVAISDALRVKVADRYYAIPLMQIERVERVDAEELIAFYQSEQHTFKISGSHYRLRYLDEMLSGNSLDSSTVNTSISLPVIIINNQTGQNLAVQVDEVVGSRLEVVVKPLGRQLTHITALSAATIMGDGSVMLILDILALIRNAPARKIIEANKKSIRSNKATRNKPQILIVDDSVTVRKVTSRLLQRHGFNTCVARDGIEALDMLQNKNVRPSLILLDIEMPRMDGFEVASHIRHDDQLKNLPIIMITSRTGDKHKQKAKEIGINGYMGKPFEDKKLINVINSMISSVAEIGDT